MGQLTVWKGTNALEQRLRYELDRGLDWAVAVAQIAAVVVPQIGRLAWLFGNMLMTALALTKEEIEAAMAAGALSPHKLAAHFYHREAYKHELLDLLEQFNHIVHRLIE